jgi:predicted MFS family arabinose efflux permease
MTRVSAAQHSSLMLLGVAFGSVIIGMLSDRLGSRLGLMRAAVLLYALSWLPWLMHVEWPLWATLGWFLLMGLLCPGFTLSWTIAKEANPPQFSGIATSVVNTGIFLGTGILQPLVGWVLDRGRAAGDTAAAWDRGLLVMAGAAAIAAVATWAPVRRRAAGM